MILVDVNLLLYAHNRNVAPHAAAKRWWEHQLSGVAPVCLCWPVLAAFIRISTSRRVLQPPLTIDEACQLVQGWLDQPCARLINPTTGHWDVLRSLLNSGQASGNLVSDAHLAALAIEYGCELCSTDADFARFPGLKWRNPLVS